MMKYLLLFISVFTIASAKAQVHKYWMRDTANVFWSHDTVYNLLADTMAFMRRDSKDTTRGTIIEIYWDKEMKHLYHRRIIGKLQSDTDWYRNGQINEISTMFGNDNGGNVNSTAWYPDGKKRLETIYQGKISTDTYYYQNGNIKHIDVSILGYASGWPEHYQWAYTEDRCENGTVMVKDSIASLRVRKIKRYHCNGTREAEFTLFISSAYGKWQWWYDNGQIKEDGQFDDISTRDTTDLSMIRSKKQGKWSYYSETGKLEREEFYKDDVLVNEKKY